MIQKLMESLKRVVMGESSVDTPKGKCFDVTDELAKDLLLQLGSPDVDIEEFKKGLAVEQEHGTVTACDQKRIAQIALDHLKETPDYYTRLAKMEKEAGIKECKVGDTELISKNGIPNFRKKRVKSVEDAISYIKSSVKPVESGGVTEKDHLNRKEGGLDTPYWGAVDKILKAIKVDARTLNQLVKWAKAGDDGMDDTENFDFHLSFMPHAAEIKNIMTDNGIIIEAMSAKRRYNKVWANVDKPREFDSMDQIKKLKDVKFVHKGDENEYFTYNDMEGKPHRGFIKSYPGHDVKECTVSDIDKINDWMKRYGIEGDDIDWDGSTLSIIRNGEVSDTYSKEQLDSHGVFESVEEDFRNKEYYTLVDSIHTEMKEKIGKFDEKLFNTLFSESGADVKEEFAFESVDETVDSAKGGEVVLWAVKKGEPAYAETIITTHADRIEDAKKWATENGFDRFRVGKYKKGAKPDFVATLRTKGTARKKNEAVDGRKDYRKMKFTKDELVRIFGDFIRHCMENGLSRKDAIDYHILKLVGLEYSKLRQQMPRGPGGTGWEDTMADIKIDLEGKAMKKAGWSNKEINKKQSGEVDESVDEDVTIHNTSFGYGRRPVTLKGWDKTGPMEYTHKSGVKVIRGAGSRAWEVVGASKDDGYAYKTAHIAMLSAVPVKANEGVDTDKESRSKMMKMLRESKKISESAYVLKWMVSRDLNNWSEKGDEKDAIEDLPNAEVVSREGSLLHIVAHKGIDAANNEEAMEKAREDTDVEDDIYDLYDEDGNLIGSGDNNGEGSDDDMEESAIKEDDNQEDGYDETVGDLEDEVTVKAGDVEAMEKHIADIVKEKQYKKINGVLVDMQTANVIKTIGDNLKSENKNTFYAMPIVKMSDLAWKLYNKVSKNEKVVRETEEVVEMEQDFKNWKEDENVWIKVIDKEDRNYGKVMQVTGTFPDFVDASIDDVHGYYDKSQYTRVGGPEKEEKPDNAESHDEPVKKTSESRTEEDLKLIQRWVRESSDWFDDWDWDGETLTVFVGGEVSERYTRKCLINKGVLKGG